MSLRPQTAWLLLTALLVVPQETRAIVPLSSKELAEHCAHYASTPEGVDATFCVRYISGFIDGAVATDERVTRNVAAQFEQRESVTARAIRTRAPVLHMLQYGSTVYAEFCLGESVPLREVVEHVIGDLESREILEERLLARDAVYAVLRRDYPCAVTEDN